MAKLINPRKAKENIIEQVSKQINDMEKFVTFLKGLSFFVCLFVLIHVSCD